MNFSLEITKIYWTELPTLLAFQLEWPDPKCEIWGVNVESSRVLGSWSRSFKLISNVEYIILYHHTKLERNLPVNVQRQANWRFFLQNHWGWWSPLSRLWISSNRSWQYTKYHSNWQFCEMFGAEVWFSWTPVTMNQDQGHSDQYEYHNAKFSSMI